jgi:hypothetical protein
VTRFCHAYFANYVEICLLRQQLAEKDSVELRPLMARPRLPRHRFHILHHLVFD